MGFDIDWGALQQPNIFASYAKGQEMGEERRQRQARQEAGNVFSTDPDRAAQILMGSGDWQSGMAVSKYAAEDRARKARQESASKYAAGDHTGARNAALASGDFDLVSEYTKMDKDQREAAKERAESLASIGVGLKGRPYEERKAILQRNAAALSELGLPPEAVQGFDPTDENIDAFAAQALGVKGQLEQADREADNQRADAQAEEVRRHNRVGEGQGQARIGISRAQLGVAQSNSARGWAAHNARLKAGGYGTPGVGVAISDDDVEIDP